MSPAEVADDRLPGWVNWLAQDADGSWWGYEVEPQRYHRGWYENELGRRLKVCQGTPNGGWTGSLRRRR